MFIMHGVTCSSFCVLTMELNSDTNGVAIPNNAVQPTRSLLDNSTDTPQNVVSIERSVKLLPASLKEGESVPPSPIRGLIEDQISPNLPLKEHNQLYSCNEECAMENKVFNDDLLRNDCTEACRFGARDGTDHVNLTFDKNNALDYNKHKDTGESIHEEKEPASASAYSEMTSDQVVSLSLAALPTADTLLICHKKKLIVLDLNGLLADIKQDFRNAHQDFPPQKIVGGKSVFKRPFCDDFLEFCFEGFHVGVWSSRRRYNVDPVVDYLMGNLRHKLLFCWPREGILYGLLNLMKLLGGYIDDPWMRYGVSALCSSCALFLIIIIFALYVYENHSTMFLIGMMYGEI